MKAKCIILNYCASVITLPFITVDADLVQREFVMMRKRLFMRRVETPCDSCWVAADDGIRWHILFYSVSIGLIDEGGMSWYVPLSQLSQRPLCCLSLLCGPVK